MVFNVFKLFSSKIYTLMHGLKPIVEHFSTPIETTPNWNFERLSGEENR